MTQYRELISQCHAMGADAYTLAAQGSDEKREQYLRLAASWAELAQDMKCAANGSSKNTK